VAADRSPYGLRVLGRKVAGLARAAVPLGARGNGWCRIGGAGENVLGVSASPLLPLPGNVGGHEQGSARPVRDGRPRLRPVMRRVLVDLDLEQVAGAGTLRRHGRRGVERKTHRLLLGADQDHLSEALTRRNVVAGRQGSGGSFSPREP